MKTFHIAPRRWGKTHQLVQAFLAALQSGEEAFIIVPFCGAKQVIQGLLPDLLQRRVLLSHHLEELRGHRLSKLFLEEFFYLDHRRLCREIPFKQYNIAIEGWGTPSKLYDQRLFQLVQRAKDGRANLEDIFLTVRLGKEKREQLQELADSFLTDPDTHIIQHRLEPAELQQRLEQAHRSGLDMDTFLAQMTGRLFR